MDAKHLFAIVVETLDHRIKDCISVSAASKKVKPFTDVNSYTLLLGTKKIN